MANNDLVVLFLLLLPFSFLLFFSLVKRTISVSSKNSFSETPKKRIVIGGKKLNSSMKD